MRDGTQPTPVTDRTEAKPRRSTSARIRRLVEAVQAAGVKIGAIEEGLDGTLRIVPAENVGPTDDGDAWLDAQA